MIFKYIIVDSGAILFNEQTTHSQVAEGFERVYSAGTVMIKISSGIFIISKIQVGSVSLSIEKERSRKRKQIDSDIILDLFFGVLASTYILNPIADRYKPVKKKKR